MEADAIAGRFVTRGHLDLHVRCRLSDRHDSNERHIGTAFVSLSDLVRHGTVRFVTSELT